MTASGRTTPEEPIAVPLTPVIAACTRWLTSAYPPPAGALNRALAEAQARQAVTLAAHLRYPTELDARLLEFLGPGGADGLDWLTGTDSHAGPDDENAWRTWVDESIVSWAACLLADPTLSARAQHALDQSDQPGRTGALGRLMLPGPRDSEAAVLMRHPDLLEPVAGLHRDALLKLLLGPDNALAT